MQTPANSRELDTSISSNDADLLWSLRYPLANSMVSFFSFNIPLIASLIESLPSTVVVATVVIVASVNSLSASERFDKCGSSGLCCAWLPLYSELWGSRLPRIPLPIL